MSTVTVLQPVTVKLAGPRGQPASSASAVASTAGQRHAAGSSSAPGVDRGGGGPEPVMMVMLATVNATCR